MEVTNKIVSKNKSVQHIPTCDETTKNEILQGLLQQPKTCSPKYLYDHLGSKLFELLYLVPEYYVNNCEQEIFAQHGLEIGETLKNYRHIFEPGCGSCEKIQALLRFLPAKTYTGFDIAAEQLQVVIKNLQQNYKNTEIYGIHGDILNQAHWQHWQDQAVHLDAGRLIFYPGSSLGNFDLPWQRFLLENFAKLAGKSGGLLIGIDLIKDLEVLQLAYDDPLGISAAFNKNILLHLNTLLSADFDLNNFVHRVHFNPDYSRMEMHLESLLKHQVIAADQVLSFEAGETIHTESSYKFTIDSFSTLAASAGWQLQNYWQDDRAYFALFYFEINR